MAKAYEELEFTDTKRESLQCLAPVRMKASSRLELY